MKKLFVLAVLVFSAGAAFANWSECKSVLNKWGIWELTCESRPGVPPDGYYAPGDPPREGDATRVEKHADGSVTVERYGREGQDAEWWEVRPGGWVRKK